LLGIREVALRPAVIAVVQVFFRVRAVAAVVTPIIAVAMQIMPGLLSLARRRSLTDSMQYVLVGSLAGVV
jgi:hypothetical protein